MFTGQIYADFLKYRINILRNHDKKVFKLVYFDRVIYRSLYTLFKRIKYLELYDYSKILVFL